MQRYANRPPLFYALVLAAISLGACAEKSSDIREKEGGFVEGRARVLTVDQSIGTATLEIDGKRVEAFWEVERANPQGGAVVRNGPLKPPVADYREVIVHRQEFPAEPGDMIAFVAMRSGRSLYMRGVRVIGR
jgi:hypothetical protein